MAKNKYREKPGKIKKMGPKGSPTIVGGKIKKPKLIKVGGIKIRSFNRLKKNIKSSLDRWSTESAMKTDKMYWKGYINGMYANNILSPGQWLKLRKFIEKKKFKGG